MGKINDHSSNKIKSYVNSFIVFAIVNCTACMVGPDFESPPSPCVDSFTENPMPNTTASTKIHGGEPQKFAWGRDLENEWWELFRSEELNELVARGLVQNPGLQAASAALKVAKENYLAGVGALFPQIYAQGTAQRERFSGASFGDAGGIKSETFSLYNATVNVSYTLDFFGGIRRNIESLCALVEYQNFILEGTYIALTANIVTAAITEAALREQIKATLELIKVQEDVLKIVKAQFELGGASNADVLIQEAALAQTRATLSPFEKSLAQTRHSLYALVGEFSSERDIPIFKLENLKLPRKLPVSVPSDLVRQRPDIRAQEALVHQASALIGVATANMLPQVTLTGYYGYEAAQLSNLFSPANVIWNYGGQLIQPIFQGGTLIAKRRAAIASFEQAAELYRQTVFQAFQNVADSLRALETDARRLKELVDAEKATRTSFELARMQLKLGAVNYITVLIAQRAYHQAVISRIQAESLRFSDTVALFQSLGGGWWNRCPIEIN